MRLQALLPITLLSLCCAAGAFAQSVQSDVSCPTLPASVMDELQWVTLQTDSALLCRAVNKGNGNEALAVTLSRKSPFRPSRDLRAEQGQVAGKTLWWYRAEIAGRPDTLVRETLVQLDSGRVAHAFIMTKDAVTLNRYQQVIQALDFATPSVATR
jgi:hypothetical protein